MTSVIAIIRRWPIASSIVAIHTLLIVVIYAVWVTSTDFWRGLIWVWVFLIDPLFYAFYSLVGYLDIQLPIGLFVLISIIIGGTQWYLLGMCFDLCWRKIFGKRRLRGT